MWKKLLPVCLELLLVLLIIVSCTQADNSSELLIPQATNTVVKVQVGQIISDTVLQLAYAQMVQSNPSWPQNVDAVLLKTGLDLSGVSGAVYFADIESNAKMQNTYRGIIASGSFNESASIANIKQQKQQNLTTTVYQGFTIYTETQNQSSLVFLSQSRFVFGSLKAVQDVIDVSKGTQPALSGSAVDSLNKEGSAMVVGASAVPANFLNQLSSDATLQSIFPVLQSADNIGFTIDQPGLNLSFRLDAHFPDTASAQNAEITVNGLISLSNQDCRVKAGKIELTFFRLQLVPEYCQANGVRIA